MKTALFIDDDEEYLYLIGRMMKEGKIPHLRQMYTAGHGQEAIDYLLAHLNDTLPDAILVDINMPVMDGHEFLAKFSELRKEYPRLQSVVPIAVMTTSTSEKDKEKVRQVEFVGNYLVKDVEMDKLCDKINELLK